MDYLFFGGNKLVSLCQQSNYFAGILFLSNDKLLTALQIPLQWVLLLRRQISSSQR